MSGSTPVTPPVAVQTSFFYDSTIQQAASLDLQNSVAAANAAVAALASFKVSPVPVINVPGAGPIVLTFPPSGDVAVVVALTAPTSYTINGGVVGQFQRIILIEVQPTTGSVVSSQLPSNVRWRGGSVPAMSSTLNQVRLTTFGTFDGGTTILGDI